MCGLCLCVHYQQSNLHPRFPCCRVGAVHSTIDCVIVKKCCVLWAGSTDVSLNFLSWSDDNTTTEWIEVALLSSCFVLLLEFRVRRGKTWVRMKGCVNFAWLWHGWVQCFNSCLLLRLVSFRFGDYFCISATKNQQIIPTENWHRITGFKNHINDRANKQSYCYKKKKMHPRPIYSLSLNE